MVEHPVQHDPDALRVKALAQLCKVRVGAQPAVDLLIVACIIAVRITFKYR